MKVWLDNTLKGQRMMADVESTSFCIGKSNDNDIVLDHPLVADQAAKIEQTDQGWTITAVGSNGCQIENHDLGPGDEVCVTVLRPITVYPYLIRFEQSDDGDLTISEERKRLDLMHSQLIHDIHFELLDRQQVETNDQQRRKSVEYQFELENAIANLADKQCLGEVGQADLVRHIAGHCVRQLIIDELIDDNGLRDDLLNNRDCYWAQLASTTSREEQELKLCVCDCIATLKLDAFDDVSEKIDSVERHFWNVWQNTSEEMLDEFLIYVAVRDLKKQTKDIIFGYGPLEDYVRLPTVSEIMVVNHDRIFVEKNGVVEKSGRRFISNKVTRTIIDRIVSQVGRRIDKSKPIVDARLLNGSRVNAVIDPIAVSLSLIHI